MHKWRDKSRLTNRLSISMLFLILLTGMIAQAGEVTTSKLELGKKLALENCQACHQYAGTEQAGTVGPPLVGMKGRFPERQKLFDIIYDPQKVLSKQTMMPPFGRNELMAKDEIESVIDFLYSL